MSKDIYKKPNTESPQNPNEKKIFIASASMTAFSELSFEPGRVMDLGKIELGRVRKDKPNNEILPEGKQ